MTSLEFWKKLPLTEKLNIARLVAERYELVPDSASDPKALEAHAELKDLAIKMLQDAIADLENPREVQMMPIVALLSEEKPTVGEEIFLGILSEATRNTADRLHWIAPGFVSIMGRFETPPDSKLVAYTEHGRIAIVVVPAPGRKPTRASQVWVKIRPPRHPSDATDAPTDEWSADGPRDGLTGALDDDDGATG